MQALKILWKTNNRVRVRMATSDDLSRNDHKQPHRPKLIQYLRSCGFAFLLV